jgi:type II secretory ATPase GspE/PulE/Tfp pilus assembly ATPase PilB-like protein
MGAEDYLLTSTVNGILAQRWCARSAQVPRAAQALPEVVRADGLEALPALGDITLYNAGRVREVRRQRATSAASASSR